ncbi:hypothetical protein ACFZAR_36370 [Streptomyces sp. NPDC008222]|uniref:hypothetical protein n=1 Tax=Streptomyces sp. NPDC008222 TaxID=3364820 RepID=UPI0036EDFCBF
MDTADDAASRLALLVEHFRQHPVTGPEGHSFTSSASQPTRTTAATPVNLAIVDHISASVRELADYTHTVNTAADPLPEDAAAVYAWCVANTRNTPEAEQQRRDSIVYRQRLEHAICAGDYSVIPPHRCPACRTFGLMWRVSQGRAVCTNRRCVDRDGMSRAWSLGRLAYEHVQSQSKIRSRRAT